MATIDVKIQHPKRVEKQWGYELWIHNDPQYCGKLLVFTNSGNKFSMHYHMLKNETWYIQEGLPHQLTALSDNSVVFEVSTEHFDEDSYRVYRNGPQDLE
jgi:hypothetical protein